MLRELTNGSWVEEGGIDDASFFFGEFGKGMAEACDRLMEEKVVNLHRSGEVQGEIVVFE